MAHHKLFKRKPSYSAFESLSFLRLKRRKNLGRSEP